MAAQSPEKVVKAFGFQPAGKEWLEALHKAQRDARQIERKKGIPDARGKIKFYVAPAEDFTNESRRALHAHDMGWFRQTTQLQEVNPHTGVMKLSACFVVYHAPSGQAQAFFAEWTARPDGDAMASAHTRVTRRFVQGLLQIAVVDEGAVPEDPPQGWSHTQAQQAPTPHPGCPHPQPALAFIGEPVWNAQKATWVDRIVCTACAVETGDWGPCPAPPQANATGPAQAPPGYVHQPQQPPQQQAPPQQQQQQSQQGYPPQQQSQQGYQAPPQSQVGVGTVQTLPVAAEPVVQQAAQILGATEITPKQMKEEQSTPPQTNTNGTSADEWKQRLLEAGMAEEDATRVAILSDKRTVSLEFTERMRGWAFSHFQGDQEAAKKAWLNVGFEPVPSLPLDQRPRPTGLQAKQFLSGITFKSPNPSS